jgi:acyl-CoA reductase-like NAD-dependent aldehyde dehydrogenase
MSKGSSSIDVFNKFSHEKMGAVHQMNWDELILIIENSKAAFEKTKKVTTEQKVSFLSALEQQLSVHKNYLAQLICSEAGKPLFYALNEVDRCIKTVRAGIEALSEMDRKELPLNLSGTPHNSAFTKRFPIGTLFGIAPFNFPLNLAMHKIIPAICTGNTLLIKPSPLAPLSLNFFIENILAPQSPIENWITVINCSDQNAEKIVLHETIKMISFTGSASIGWHLKEISGKKKIALELGGNAAVIVDNDIDLKSVAEKCCFGAYLYGGQICISTQRIYVHEDVFEAFLGEMVEAVQNITSGNPKENVINGPIISNVHFLRIQEWVKEALSQGAKIVFGAEVLLNENHVYSPTLLTKTTKDMKVVAEEVFGPVAIIEPFSTFEEAIDKVNDSKYGLQTGVFTHSSIHKELAFNEIESGGVIINNIPGFRIDEMPYGGIKDSGMGREGVKYAIQESTEMKLYID